MKPKKYKNINKRRNQNQKEARVTLSHESARDNISEIRTSYFFCASCCELRAGGETRGGSMRLAGPGENELNKFLMRSANPGG